MFTLKRVLLLFTALTMLTAAGWDEKPWKMTAEEFLPIIQEYNALLVKAYKRGDAQVVKKAALDDEVENVRQTIAKFAGNNLKALATLKSLKIVGMQRSDPSSYAVLTEEKWDYKYVDITTGKVKEKETDVLYSMVYQFRYRNGRWMISLSHTREQYQKMLDSAM